VTMPTTVPTTDGWLRRNALVLLYVLLIVACVVFAPDAPLNFIYTEF
jgi:predicted MFS family arabinose efflux permease